MMKPCWSRRPSLSGALALSLTALVLGCGASAPEKSPTDTLKSLARLVETQTLGPVWEDYLSADRQKRLDRAMRRVLEKNEQYKPMLEQSSQALFVSATFPMLLGADTSFAFKAVVAEKVDGSRAAVSVSYADNSVREFQFVAEGDLWRLDAVQGSEVLSPVLAGAESTADWKLR